MKSALEPNEIGRMEGLASCLRDRLIVRLLYRLACRVSELLGLRVEEIDFKERTVLIAHEKRVPRKQCPKCGQKAGRRSLFCSRCAAPFEAGSDEVVQRQRLIAIDPGSLDLLREYIARGGPRDGRLFPLTRQMAYYIIRDLARRAGLGGQMLLLPDTGHRHFVSPHRFRDAFAVQAVARDDTPDAMRHLQDHLGHQHFNTTAKYLKYGMEQQRDWYDSLWPKEEVPA